MAKTDYPDEIRILIAELKRLPGVGARSAERMALWMMRSRQTPAEDLSRALITASQEVMLCAACGFFASRAAGCRICQDDGRDPAMLCVVEQSTDILPLERTGAFRGHYHALHGRISPLDNVGPEDIRIAPLLQRAREGVLTEILLATGSDVEGEATARYLASLLQQAVPHIRITRLAQGLPAGGGLESADELTLFRAINGRGTW